MIISYDVGGYVFKNEGISKWDFYSLYILRMCSLVVSKKSIIFRLFCLR